MSFSRLPGAIYQVKVAKLQWAQLGMETAVV